MTEGLIRGVITHKTVIVPVDDVIVRERQRAVDADHVKRIKLSFQDLGGQLQLQPIVIDGDNILVDGAHRLEAAKQAGWTHIRAERFDGLTAEDRPLLEAEANRIRKQLTPLEIEEAWSKYYEPAFKARAKQNQERGIANLRQGNDSPVTANYSNRESGPVPVTPVSIASAAKDATGLSLQSINKIRDVREIAESGTASDELRAAAERGLKKLKRTGASVDAVHRGLLEIQERERRRTSDPSMLQQQELEKRLDRTLSDTTLMTERLTGQLGDDLGAAAALEQANVETLRGVRIALTQSLAAVLAIECTVAPDGPGNALQRIGGEVTRMLSEHATSRLGQGAAHE